MCLLVGQAVTICGDVPTIGIQAHIPCLRTNASQGSITRLALSISSTCDAVPAFAAFGALISCKQQLGYRACWLHVAYWLRVRCAAPNPVADTVKLPLHANPHSGSARSIKQVLTVNSCSSSGCCAASAARDEWLRLRLNSSLCSVSSLLICFTWGPRGRHTGETVNHGAAGNDCLV